MRSIRRLVVLPFFFLVASTMSFAQFPMTMQRPPEDTRQAQVHELVSKYCRLDYDGSRLDPSAWPKFQPLVWWSAMPEVAKIDVIARYSVDPEPSEDKGKYAVTVHYRLLGTFDPALGYIREPEGSMQDVYFSVTSQNTDWRISDADNTLPHPSRAAMLKWLAQQISTTQDAAAKERYQGALQQLQEQSASPFAK